MRDPRYPENWNAIALTKKQSVAWRCEKCGRAIRLTSKTLTV